MNNRCLSQNYMKQWVNLVVEPLGGGRGNKQTYFKRDPFWNVVTISSSMNIYISYCREPVLTSVNDNIRRYTQSVIVGHYMAFCEQQSINTVF